MKAYRYNAKDRKDRRFNNCGSEKNPNNFKFYATNLQYAEKYKFVYLRSGELDYECDLEIVEIEENDLFDMTNNFEKLQTYKKYVKSMISMMERDYKMALERATKVREKKMFQGFIDGLATEEENIKHKLISEEFQSLSDFDFQNDLVNELKAMGFDGYMTDNEIAIF